jgi:hypothetical protein
MRYRVHQVRKADPRELGDRVAIQQSQEEINSARMDAAVRAGLLLNKGRAARAASTSAALSASRCRQL